VSAQEEHDPPAGFVPYPEQAPELLAGGWAPLPIPYGRKFPPPDDTTGGHPLPSGPDVHEWIEDPKHANANTAARMPEEVLGIDVDAYGRTEVMETLERMEVDAGAILPPTWIVTSRDDGMSGIRH
jgi:hypothetical protein